MANGFGSLYVGASAIQTQQNALNVVANNLSNVNTKGYVRQQVLFADRNYTSFASAAVSDQRLGLGVDIGDVIHARDVFLDKAYRSESGRQAFYAAGYDAISEVETFLQETQGKSFQEALANLYEAFAEYAKDPSDSVNQNLVMQKASLFISRAANLNDGLRNYQSTINKKISDDVDRINDLGKKISELNLKIQRIEAANVETAMDLRDTRDVYLDELSRLAKTTYSESADGVVKVQLDGVEFVIETQCYPMAMQEDLFTGFKTPYWPQLSDVNKEIYTYAFNTGNANAVNNTDIGEVKALLLARGDHRANYMDMEGLGAYEYETGLSNSVMMNTQAELDKLVHEMITSINDILCPNVTAGEAKQLEGETLPQDAILPGGKTCTINEYTKILDVTNCCVGSDGKLPPQELFSRVGSSRYTEATLNGKTIYIYNEEDPKDLSKCYTLEDVEVNRALVAEESLLAHKTQDGKIAYDLAQDLVRAWDKSEFTTNPSDTTPSTFTEFYTKWVGEVGTTGSVFHTTATSLQATSDTIDNNRQMVLGVSSDEELTNMIRYQQAYNAASRYINVISSMIEYLLSSV